MAPRGPEGAVPTAQRREAAGGLAPSEAGGATGWSEMQTTREPFEKGAPSRSCDSANVRFADTVGGSWQQ